MKSGRVRLAIGDVEYVVTDGVACKNRCEFHWINTSTRDCLYVSDVETRALAALDIEHMLASGQTVAPGDASVGAAAGPS